MIYKNVRPYAAEVGEVITLRAAFYFFGENMPALVPVATSLEAFDDLQDAGGKGDERLIELAAAGRIVVLPTSTKGRVARFRITPRRGAFCARLDLVHGPADVPSVWVQMVQTDDGRFDSQISELHRRHPEYFAAASRRETGTLEALYLARVLVAMNLQSSSPHSTPQQRRDIEQRTRRAEQMFCEYREFVRQSPAFCALTPAHRSAIEVDCFTVPFEGDPWEG